MPEKSRGTTFFCPYLYRERFSVEIKRYRVPIAGLPAPFHGYTILQISDLHDKEFGSGGRDLLELLGPESFDLAVLTGDLVLGPRYRLTPALDLVGGLRRTPLYSVSGNHDWGESGTDWRLGESIKGALDGAGVRVLSNESVAVEKEGHRIWLVGVDDPVTGKDRMERALIDIPEGEPRLLLSHSPHLFPEAARHRIGLVLAGHTHGGQIRLPLLGAPYIPRMGWFPPWVHGYFSSGATRMVVNAGLGESWLQVRLNIRPEVALITLEPEQSVA